MDFELLKAIIGVLSIALATTSGVAALIVDFRDKDTGRITKWGRYAVVGLAISFFVGALNLWIDYLQKSQEARASAVQSLELSQRTLRTVTDISRTLNPIKEVKAGFFINFSFKEPELSEYRERLSQGVQALSKELRSDKLPTGVVAAMFSGDGKELIEVDLNSSSSLFPDKNKEPGAYALLSDHALDAKLFKTPIDPQTYAWYMTSDINIVFQNKDPSQVQNQLLIAYYPTTDRVSLKGSTIAADTDEWNSSGKILSTLDLPGAQIIFHIEPFDGIQPSNISVYLSIGNRRSWYFGSNNNTIKSYLISDKETQPYKIWVYTFPDTFEAILHNLETK